MKLCWTASYRTDFSRVRLSERLCTREKRRANSVDRRRLENPLVRLRQPSFIRPSASALVAAFARLLSLALARLLFAMSTRSLLYRRRIVERREITCFGRVTPARWSARHRACAKRRPFAAVDTIHIAWRSATPSIAANSRRRQSRRCEPSRPSLIDELHRRQRSAATCRRYTCCRSPPRQPKYQSTATRPRSPSCASRRCRHRQRRAVTASVARIFGARAARSVLLILSPCLWLLIELYQL